MSTKREDEDLAMVRSHVEQLGEHFDTVMVFATRHEPGTLHGTVHCQFGSGNLFARLGHVRDWLMREDESTRMAARKTESGDY